MKKVKLFFGFSLLILLIGSYSFAMASDIPKTLSFGLLPAEDAAEMIKQFQGIAEHIGKAVGLPIETRVSQSYNALIEAMNAGHIDVAYLGGSQYVAARRVGIDCQPVVVAKAQTGRTYYKSCIIVRAESDIKCVEDLKGKTFAFVSPTSTSGGVGPRFIMLKHGINPEKDLRRILYAGKHDSVFLAVMNKKVDAGGTGDVYFPRWKGRGILKYTEYIEPQDMLKDGDIRVVAAVKVPGTVMIARGALGQGFIEKLRAAFQSVPKEELNKYRIWGPLLGFVPASHEDYKELAEMKELARKLKKKK